MKQRCDKTNRSSLGWKPWGLVVLAIGLTMGGFVSTVSAEGGNIRYSYEEVRVAGDREFVLVPRAESALRGEVTQNTLNQAFEALRKAKRPTYGNSYASISGNVPYGATVEVHIDSNHSDFAPIIIAEAVYTLTEFGVPEVHFPGHAEGGLTRADISFPAYTLTVPLWTVVPDTNVTTAQVLMPNGELIPVAQVEQMWAEDREGVVDKVYEFIDSEEAYTVRSVTRILPELGELRLDKITPLLGDDERVVRRQSLRTLDGFEDDDDVLSAVSGALADESSSSLAREMAEFLGESSDKKFNVEKQFFLIARGDDEEAETAAAGLYRWNDDARVVETLTELLRDEREAVANAAVGSLDSLEAHEERAEALEDSEVDGAIRTSLAADLADDGNAEETRLIGLTYLANEREGGHASQTIALIAGLSIDAAREQVEAFLSDEAPAKRRGAIEALKSRDDVASIAGLMAASEQPEGDLMREAAYDIMVSQSLEEIMEQTSSSVADVQKVAYQAIGERASRDGVQEEAVATIEEGIDHNQAAIRGAAARSLGEIGGDDALETLGRMTGDSSPVVRRAVALALGTFDTTEHARTLVGYLDDDDPGVVAAAIDAMEQRNDQRAADRIEEFVRSDNPQIKASALRAVTTFLPEDDDAVRRHMGMLSGAVNDEAVDVQLSALEQLGRFEIDIAVTNIAQQIGSQDIRVRAAAVRALGETGHDDAVRPLERALNDEDALVRREAIEALSELVGSAARPELEARMEQEEDPEIKELIETHLQSI